MEYVESLNGSPTIILINGQQLTEYIYDYGLGLQTEKVLKVMKMDMDYWDAMDNASIVLQLCNFSIQLNLTYRFGMGHLTFNGRYFRITEGMSKYPLYKCGCL